MVQDDEVVAEYDVFLTPVLQQQILLLQYLNQPRDKPYTARGGARLDGLRIKPKSGFLELDLQMHQAHNFNKFQSLKWGDALQTAKTLQNETATYGPASGFALSRIRPSNRGQLKDTADRETQMLEDLNNLETAREGGRLLANQTMGGKLNQHDANADGAQPMYFVGAFSGKQLHLSKVDSTVQMRPQFHHIDAEDQRNRVATSRAAAAAAATEAEPARPPPPARALQQSYKDLNDDKDKDAPERRMRQLLQDAEEEDWMDLRYVDEQEELAYETFNRYLFVDHPEDSKLLKSTLDAEKYLDEISLPKHDLHRRKKRPSRKKDVQAESV